MIIRATREKRLWRVCMVTTPKHNCVPRCCMYSSEFRLPLKHAPLCSEGKFVGQLSGQGQCLEWAKRSQCVLQTNLRLNVPPPPLLHAPSSPPPPFFSFFLDRSCTFGFSGSIRQPVRYWHQAPNTSNRTTSSCCIWPLFNFAV